jgi:hypothetical protein
VAYLSYLCVPSSPSSNELISIAYVIGGDDLTRCHMPTDFDKRLSFILAEESL